MPYRSLPPGPDLAHLRHQAKDLLRAVTAGSADALARVREFHPRFSRKDDQETGLAPFALADAQLVIAREYGFESWPKLKAHVQSARTSPPPSVLEELRRAFGARDASAVRSLLNRHPDAQALLNEPLFPFDAPALVHVAGQNDLALANVLLEFGADPNQRSRWWAGGWHVLHAARGTVAERLLDAGAVPDACAAANLDRPDLLHDILFADESRVHERGGDGQTPLHFARSREVVDLLLQYGADPDARDLDHRGTPAQWMLDGRRGGERYELAIHLVERGATPDIFLAAALGLTTSLRKMLESDPSLPGRRTGQGEYGERSPGSFHIYMWTIGQNLSPLQVAAQFEQYAALEILQAVAGPTERFLAACSDGRAADAEHVLRQHPDLINKLTPEEQRVLPDAGWRANTEAVELMLELGFDPATAGQDGGTVLHCAAWQGATACVEAALHHPGVRRLINQTDPMHGSTPLGWCCHGAANCANPDGDYPTVARLLLAAGAHPGRNLQDAPAEVIAVIREYGGG